MSRDASAIDAPIVFISHSEKDKALAEALVELLEKKFRLGDNDIRSTSSAGYAAPHGDVSEKLKNDIEHCKIVIALFTPAGVDSAWVWMECGAAWMVNPAKMICVFTADSLREAAPHPIRGQNCVTGHDGNAKTKFSNYLDEMGRRCELEPRDHRATIDRLDKFMIELERAAVPVGPDALPFPEFCQISHDCSAKRIERREVAKQDDGILFHTYLNVVENRRFRAVHDAIKDYFLPYRKPKGVSDAALWSLLGSMELAVTFRATDSKVGAKLQADLVDHFNRTIAKFDWRTEIDVYHYELASEYFWENGRYVPGRRTPELEFLKSDRSTHVFVRLQYRNAVSAEGGQAIDPETHEQAVQTLKNLFAAENKINGKDFHVDLYGLTKNEDFVIIEMHLPCGQQESIKFLSKKLESELGHWNKETLIVYDMDVLVPPEE